MNAAFAKFFAGLWNEPMVFAPYVAAGYGDAANAMLAFHEQIPAGSDHDRELVDAWAKYTGLDLLNAGHFKQALPILTTLYHKDPSDVDTLYRLGLAYSELNQYRQAADLLEKAVEIAPDHIHAMVGLGVAEVAVGNLSYWRGMASQSYPA